VKDRIKEVLLAHNVQYDMPATHGYGKSGNFDFVCCVAGAYLGIEAKRDDKEPPTALQTDHAEAVMRAGGAVLLIHKDNTHLVARAIINLRNGRKVLNCWPAQRAESPDNIAPPTLRKKGIPA
jgi:hypothetical protein